MLDNDLKMLPGEVRTSGLRGTQEPGTCRLAPEVAEEPSFVGFGC